MQGIEVSAEALPNIRLDPNRIGAAVAPSMVTGDSEPAPPCPSSELGTSCPRARDRAPTEHSPLEKDAPLSLLWTTLEGPTETCAGFDPLEGPPEGVQASEGLRCACDSANDVDDEGSLGVA